MIMIQSSAAGMVITLCQTIPAMTTKMIFSIDFRIFFSTDINGGALKYSTVNSLFRRTRHMLKIKKTFLLFAPSDENFKSETSLLVVLRVARRSRLLRSLIKRATICLVATSSYPLQYGQPHVSVKPSLK